MRNLVAGHDVVHALFREPPNGLQVGIGCWIGKALCVRFLLVKDAVDIVAE